jgi:putative membrane protein
MGIQKKLRVSRYFFVAALAAAALGGCSATRQQPAPDANANAAVSSPAAQPTQAAEAKPRAAHVPSAEVSSKKTNAAILEQIHQANLKEIEIGKLAEEKASTDEVRAYAVQLVNDHTNADQMVTAAAQKKGVRLRDSTAARRESARGKVAGQKLSSASGTQFDRLFLERTSADHKKLIGELQQEREDATDDDIEALIDKIVPILQQHNDLAQILMKKEQASTGPIRNHG